MAENQKTPGLFRQILDNPTFSEKGLLGAPAKVGMEVGGKLVKNLGYMMALAGRASNDPVARGLGTYVSDAIVSGEMNKVRQDAVKQILENIDNPDVLAQIMSGQTLEKPGIPMPGARSTAARQAIQDVRQTQAIKMAPLEFKAQKLRNKLLKLNYGNYDVRMAMEQKSLEIAEKNQVLANKKFELDQDAQILDMYINEYKLSDEWQNEMRMTPGAERRHKEAAIAKLQQDVRVGLVQYFKSEVDGSYHLMRFNDETKQLEFYSAPELPWIKGHDNDVSKMEYELPGRPGLKSIGKYNVRTDEFSPLVHAGTGRPVIVDVAPPSSSPALPGAAQYAIFNLQSKYGKQLTEVLETKYRKLVNLDAAKAAKGDRLSRDEYDVMKALGANRKLLTGAALDAEGNVINPTADQMISLIRVHLGEEAHKDAREVANKSWAAARDGMTYNWITDTRETTAELFGIKSSTNPDVSDKAISGGSVPYKDPFSGLIDSLRELGGEGGAPQHQVRDETRPVPKSTTKGRDVSEILSDIDSSTTQSVLGHDANALRELLEERRILSKEELIQLEDRIRKHAEAGLAGDDLDVVIDLWLKLYNLAKQGKE